MSLQSVHGSGFALWFAMCFHVVRYVRLERSPAAALGPRNHVPPVSGGRRKAAAGIAAVQHFRGFGFRFLEDPAERA